MSKIIALGAVSEVTKALYVAGTVMDGAKTLDPNFGWVYMKTNPGTRVDPSPPF